MLRSFMLPTAALLLCLPPVVAQVRAEVELPDYAAALASAAAALEGGDGPTARRLLDATDRQVRGTAFNLLRHLANQDDPQQALRGRALPKPELRAAIGVLNPTRPSVARFCDRGVILLHDLRQLEKQPRKVVSSRKKPLVNGGFSGDGKFLAAGDTEGGIIVWDTASWNEAACYVEGTRPVRFVALDKTGSRLLAETEDGVVLWDLAGGREVGQIARRLNFGTALCFSDDQRYCATGGLAAVTIHDAQTGESVREIRHAPYTMHVAFSPDGRYVASGLRGSLNKWLGVFDVATGETVFDRARHDGGITGLVFIDQGKCLLSTSADGTMKFWDVPSGTQLVELRMGASIYVPSVTRDGTAILWNQRSGPRFFLVP